jgi:hypothetical protein
MEEIVGCVFGRRFRRVYIRRTLEREAYVREICVGKYVYGN